MALKKTEKELIFGIYQVRDAEGKLMYIGSTSLELWELEYNHRNWITKEYSRTDFREALIVDGEDWTFSWLIAPRHTNKFTITIEEGALIRALNPKYNQKTKWGQYPVAACFNSTNKQYIKPEDRVFE